MNLLGTSSLYAPDGRHEYSVNELRPFFLGAPDLPVKVPHGDVLQVAPGQRGAPSLSYSFVPGHGYSLVWERFDATGARRPVMMSVQDPAGMDDWTQNPDQSVFPRGSLVPGEMAIKVVEDFARNPEVLSGAVEWVDVKALNWPDP